MSELDPTRIREWARLAKERAAWGHLREPIADDLEELIEAVPALIEAWIEERARREWAEERITCINCSECLACSSHDTGEGGEPTAEGLAKRIAKGRREAGLP